MEGDENKKYPRWKNQYIDLVDSDSEHIISIYSRTIPEDKLTLFKARIAQFEHSICEIGSGSGGHLIQKAAQQPNILFVGFETRFKRAFKTAEKAKKNGLKNVLLMRADARFIPQLYPAMSLAGVYINFPDPWDKPRWKKNRILNQEFLHVLANTLKDGGFLSYKTDHREYFDETLTALEKVRQFTLQDCSTDLYSSQFLANNVATEFESLFKSQGISICYLLARKIGGISNSSV